MDDLVDGMERMGQTSFLDLPDEIIIMIMKKLDIPNQYKLLFNKRMIGLQFQVKNKIYELRLSIYQDHNTLVVKPSNRRSPYRIKSIEWVVETFCRLALNTIVNKIDVLIMDEHNENIGSILAALSNFEADEVRVRTEDEDGDDRELHLPQLNLSTILAFAQNVRRLNLSYMIISLTAQDLCGLRKMMLKGGCKMEDFMIDLNEDGVHESFIEQCFGVTFEKNREAKTIIYRTTNQSVEIYFDEPGWMLHHFEGDIWTTSGPDLFALQKCDTAEVRTHKSKIEMNHSYGW